MLHILSKFSRRSTTKRKRSDTRNSVRKYFTTYTYRIEKIMLKILTHNEIDNRYVLITFIILA